MPLALSLALALALAVGGLARGLAQPGAMTAGVGLTEMVICADGGQASVLVDAQGNVVDPDQPCQQHHCDQCLMAGAVALASPAFVPEAPRPAARPAHPLTLVLATIRHPLRLFARGPPLKV